MDVSLLPRFPEISPVTRGRPVPRQPPPSGRLARTWLTVRAGLLALRRFPEFLVGWRRWHFWRLAAHALIVALLMLTCTTLLIGALYRVRATSNRVQQMDNLKNFRWFDVENQM